MTRRQIHAGRESRVVQPRNADGTGTKSDRAVERRCITFVIDDDDFVVRLQERRERRKATLEGLVVAITHDDDGTRHRPALYPRLG
jgi:hypothetical protein